MKLKDAIVQRIYDLCQDRDITINKLCTICGITQSTLNSIINSGSKRPTVATIKKICDGLEIRLADFFASEYFDNLDQEWE